MGLALSILYLVTAYLTPYAVFGSLAVYRVELILAFVIALVSLPAIASSAVPKTVQSVALIGLAFATMMSLIVGQRWLGGSVTAILLFLPNAFAYYLVCLHCKSKARLQLIIVTLIFVCFFVIGKGATEMHRGLPATRSEYDTGIETPYFFGMENSSGQWFYRLRGLGEINDPNDFAQLIVCVIPLTFVFWRPKKYIRNLVFVLAPVSILLWGAYLTHSRGSMLALLAVVIMAVRRRIGTVSAVILAITLFFAASALHYTGGRDISASAGEDREALWGDGLDLLKTHPIFGVGLGKMTEYAPQTAHNSIVVCGAELGLVGLYFWSMFLLPSVRDALVVASPERVTEREPFVPDPSPYALSAAPNDKLDKNEINRLGRLLVLSFTGFMVTGWFLSRAFVMTLFLLGGLTEALYQMALTRGMISPRLPFGRVLRHAGVLTVALVVVMYVVVRLLNVMR